MNCGFSSTTRAQRSDQPLGHLFGRMEEAQVPKAPSHSDGRLPRDTETLDGYPLVNQYTELENDHLDLIYLLKNIKHGDVPQLYYSLY